MLSDQRQRANAQKELERCEESAVEPLMKALDYSSNSTTRLYAVESLGKIGWQAKLAVSNLVSVSQEDSDLQVRSKAIRSLSAIAQDSQAHSDDLNGWQLGEIRALQDLHEKLKNVLEAVKKDKTDWESKKADVETLRLARSALQNRLRNLTDQPTYQAVSWAQSHPWVLGTGLILITVGSVYGGIFWVRPLWLLKFGIEDKKIAAAEKIPHAGPWLAGLLKLLSPLKYHPRVLDAWVEQNWAKAKYQFLRSETVKERKIYIPLPVDLDGKLFKELNGNDLLSTFQHKTAVLLITGEGGAGKTSLSCQIALWGIEKHLMSHRLLPVLIETELDEDKTLIKVIEGRLKILTDSEDDISPDLLQKLLQHQRVLVIVDHLSEMSEATRRQVTPELAQFPAKALLVTSRLAEDLGGVKTVLKPLQIEAHRLWPFISSYIIAINQKDLFVNDEYHDACDRLGRIVGERPITVLLARLYIDHLIQERLGAGGILPDSVPKLMLSYLNRLNQNVDIARKQDDLEVHRAAQIIAWVSLQKNYRPTWIKKEDAIAALKTQMLNKDSQDPDKEAKVLVDYLESSLQLLQTPDPKVKTRIILDPLAEYLAANYCVENHSRQENPDEAWREFFQKIDQRLYQYNETTEVIRGFMLAVWDCCEDQASEGRIPAFVTTELDLKADVNRKELEQVQEKRRIRKLISELSAPELKYRISAAEDLSSWGNAAQDARSNLVGMLRNRNQPLEARQAAAQALGKLGFEPEILLNLLNDQKVEAALRRSIAIALGLMKAGKDELYTLLIDEQQLLPIRQGAATALGLIGSNDGETVPMLIVDLKAECISTQVKPILVWTETLGSDINLKLVNIQGGEFLMGSPPDEADRNSYDDRRPDLEGVDVEFQHCVRIQPFAMSQFPITQAQWRLVAALTPVNMELELELDPAHFKGDNRPVESISWLDALEFCGRLSILTGKNYRLPSEAEWEYACRAETTTRFHFGENLSVEIANYNPYNRRDRIRKRDVSFKETTPVDHFGVANAYGLCDMHGNVYEWCQDQGHFSYVGAPADGSAWITDEFDSHKRLRVLRGGSFYSTMSLARSARRSFEHPEHIDSDIGFRVVCDSNSKILKPGE